jgi:hypothetical protein
VKKDRKMIRYLKVKNYNAPQLKEMIAGFPWTDIMRKGVVAAHGLTTRLPGGQNVLPVEGLFDIH